MAVPAQVPHATKPVDPRTAIGAVGLTVSDLARSQQFYERAIGLVARQLGDGEVGLGTVDGPPLVKLRGDPAAPRLNRRATGLYHQAILLPSRRDLAVALARLAAARWPLDGASDHLVSEALYLSDPDGNGIELYRDRPRETWPRSGDGVRMDTLRLDLDDLIGEMAGAQEIEARVPDGTRIGHVHLQTAELTEIEAFYGGVIGLDVMVRLGPSALFMSAGGYHHHVGLNTWHSAGAARPRLGAVGLRHYEIVLPTQSERELILGRAQAAGLTVTRTDDDDPLLTDPSGNAVALVV